MGRPKTGLTTCSIDGCNKPTRGPHFCEPHRDEFRRISVNLELVEVRKNGLCTRCKKAQANKPYRMCEACGKKVALYQKSLLVKLRRELLLLYEGSCACCGETNEVFLTIDHMNNDGHLERNSKGKSLNAASSYYRQLIRQKREDIQILCYNCNGAKARVGGCPHSDPSITLMSGRPTRKGLIKL